MARKVEYLSWKEMKEVIRAGARVTGRFPSGLRIRRDKTCQEYSEQTGRVVIAPSRIDSVDWFVLNMGGQHGIPKVVTEHNFVQAWKNGKCYKLLK